MLSRRSSRVLNWFVSGGQWDPMSFFLKAMTMPFFWRSSDQPKEFVVSSTTGRSSGAQSTTFDPESLIWCASSEAV